ncbi:hypothetical protein D0962_26050 [Leptolyngbyaceae cyanobacterium CCMR0082]|uniref:Uncharacterized protein n=1 Tax=Adonisia turfae CCMR0082 TaxID=2304604 RepID=A0A6M0SCJ5_9CYAN|nr:hypothetical protein [Adonisia turfae]MDV3353847.1 hypothetical protein [Leptothoe sp. LEGE 181152]NEZ66184.1 hypothetical protein [Adonisia turfae CCMR0082]
MEIKRIEDILSAQQKFAQQLQQQMQQFSQQTSPGSFTLADKKRQLQQYEQRLNTTKKAREASISRFDTDIRRYDQEIERLKREIQANDTGVRRKQQG